MRRGGGHQVCSPLIQVGLSLIEASVKLPLNVSTLLGPCGDICNYALCGLNILCAEEAAPLLMLVRSFRCMCVCVRPHLLSIVLM